MPLGDSNKEFINSKGFQVIIRFAVFSIGIFQLLSGFTSNKTSNFKINAIEILNFR